MPTYEYRCVDCGNRVEVFQRLGDEPLTICAVCGGTLRKVFHPAGIVFKGSGFYATDSRSRSGGDGKAADKKEPQKSGGGEGTKGSSEKSASGESSGPSKAKEATS